MALTDITGGPAQLLVDDAELSHTQGGVTVRVAPQQRQRTVDQYGNTPVDVIHQGDEVRVTAPLAEWNANVLAAIYAPGNDQTSGSGTGYVGIGRSAGFIYGKHDIKVVPRLTSDQSKKAQFFACAPVGELELVHNTDDDFSAEFVACVDDQQTDGELIGKLFL